MRHSRGGEPSPGNPALELKLIEDVANANVINGSGWSAFVIWAPMRVHDLRPASSATHTLMLAKPRRERFIWLHALGEQLNASGWTGNLVTTLFFL